MAERQLTVGVKKTKKKKRLVDKVFNKGGIISKLKSRSQREMDKLGL